MADAAARIGVGDVDQFLDGVLAVADDMRWNPLGHRHDLVVDDQNPVVLAGDETFDLDNARRGFRPARPGRTR